SRVQNVVIGRRSIVRAQRVDHCSTRSQPTHITEVALSAKAISCGAALPALGGAGSARPTRAGSTHARGPASRHCALRKPAGDERDNLISGTVLRALGRAGNLIALEASSGDGVSCERDMPGSPSNAAAIALVTSASTVMASAANATRHAR